MGWKGGEYDKNAFFFTKSKTSHNNAKMIRTTTKKFNH